MKCYIDTGEGGEMTIRQADTLCAVCIDYFGKAPCDADSWYNRFNPKPIHSAEVAK